MGYIRLGEQPGEVYHYTHQKNLDSILRDGRIRRMGDMIRRKNGKHCSPSMPWKWRRR